MDPATTLDVADRGMLAVAGRRGPLLSPMAAWWDGAGLWMTTAADATKVGVLRREPRCAFAVPAHADEPGALARGRARVLGPDEPLRLALHAPAISGAVTALTLRNLPAVADYAWQAARVPSRWRAHRRVVVRVAVDDVTPLLPAPHVPGVPPPLPTEIPRGVRRRLSGRREVLVATEDAPPQVTTASWAGGRRLAFPRDVMLPERTRAVVAVDDDDGRPTGVTGVALHGTLARDGAFAPERATWWDGFALQTVEVAPPTEAGLTLPD